MIDPVNNFQIPEEWVKRARMSIKELKTCISGGRFVLLSDGSLLRRGYTTGTTATAAVKASVLSLKKEVSAVSVPTPAGIRAILPVLAKNGKASATKDPGDHAFDVTGGIKIIAEAREHDSILIKAGMGIGSKKGIPAINPSPMRQIEEAVKEALSETGLKGAYVIISVPEGEEIAKKTLNGKLGITGGISILGTTGFVEPWNEHLGEMKEELIRSADKLILTTGRLGMRFSHMLFPGYEVVLIGSDISRGLKAAKGEVILCGLPGLILKWAFPGILKDSGYLTVQEMIEADMKNPLIDMALERAVKLSGKRVVLLNRDGTVLRDSGEKA
ncbi:cobalt-precorrin-5B (C(1))-methyltransferase [Candidatus Methanoperedens nitratireducens]|uniref:Cobalt-precorrin-5B C(1)-methyltransferase n=1 Tax=Candidatus Methanoperedens nitratireducens TaxID=1392998 RepID=A0A284VIM0_9EURY|nr:cobalt-precorrin-5B (C(1))-methyltransferase [Candidatus Methanoperedens nitroreducens]SNQ59039.1 putative cobalt-precorrin-6A synthase (deacetylating) [Candidatus Methanoperedens nitroreducens]